MKNRIWKNLESSVLGFAIGDAMGVPLEFLAREDLIHHPVTKMLEYGSHDVPKGTWSDDTSMVLATMASIIETKGLNCNSIAEHFCMWINDAKYTATDVVFDIGTTTKYAILRYYHNHVAAETCGGATIHDNGNGSLMRMLPIALYTYYLNFSQDQMLETVALTSSVTHAHERSILGCYLYVSYLHKLFDGNDKRTAYRLLREEDLSAFSKDSIEAYHRLLYSNIECVPLESISSSGYIVDTLESVIWVILNTNQFKEAIIGAINLGDDTDTIGALVGSIAGVLYGTVTFPKLWKKELKKREYIIEMCYNFERTLNELKNSLKSRK